MIRRAKLTPRRGTVLPLVAMCCIALMGMVALAIDIGMIAVARNQSQNAADSSAMAGARTISGDASGNYNIAAVPGNAVAAAVANKIFANYVPGSTSTIKTDPATDANGNNYIYITGDVKIELGAYAYVYNDANPALEGFTIQIPQTVTTEPYSGVRTTISYQGGFNFGRVFGLNTYNTGAVALAVHRPRDVMIVVDLSGSMRFQSLAGVPLTGTDNWGNTGTFAACSSSTLVRAMSMNPDTIIPQFGHYSDVSGAALQGSTTYHANSGEFVDLCNQTTATGTNSGPAVVGDFYQNPVGTPPSSSNLAFIAAPSSYTTAPGGDNYLQTNLDTGGTYAQTVAQFNGPTGSPNANTNPIFETQGYKAFGGRTQFYGYTQGPAYWGKTFWIWPPQPGAKQGNPWVAPPANPPASLSDTTFKWYDNGSRDWRQRFFIMVDTSNNAPYWLNHNSVLFDSGPPGATIKAPGNTTTVSEVVNGVTTTKTYDIRPNYAAILYWLNDPSQGPQPFPPTLQAGRIRYYSAIPNGTDNTLNNRWWTTPNTSLPNDERFWKEYIDFVLGYGGNAGSYTRLQNGSPISGRIGNGDYYQWTGSTIQTKTRPTPWPPANAPGSPYQSDFINNTGGYAKGATKLNVNGLPALPTVNKDYCIINNDWNNPYLIVGDSTTTISISPALANNVPNSATVQVFSPYMDYNDNPFRPRHQFWFGPGTMVDWLGNYNLYTGAFGGPHHWWPGNCHEAHAWACKVGIQSAIDDIRTNHPSDFVGLTFFSSPVYSSGGSGGHHNKAAVPMGRSYQMLKDSLWFPPTTVTGTNTEIGPYDADMPQVPRSDGGTSPEMGFMIAYNQFSSSTANLRFYAQPQPQYRGSAGGLGRKGAARLVIFETDGFPNTRANAVLAGGGADSYYPIRVYDPTNMGDPKSVEWPSGGTYTDTDVFPVVQQITAMNTASPPGYSTVLKPALVHCIGYGSIFDPANAGLGQTKALTFLQTVRFYGNTASDTNPANFPAWAQIYGTNAQRVANMQTAFTNIMQSGVQVSLIK
jgi:hypothetical protein